MKIFLLLLLSTSPAFAEAPCNDAGKIYRLCADQTKIYADTLARAAKEKKLAVVVLGADWCPWCQSMHKIFADPAPYAERFVLAEIGIYNGRDKNISGEKVLEQVMREAKLTERPKGVPMLAVVNPKTKAAVLIDTGDLEQNTKEKKGHDPKKIWAALESARAKVGRAGP